MRPLRWARPLSRRFCTRSLPSGLSPTVRRLQVFGVGAAGLAAAYAWRGKKEEIELPAVPEPATFQHPYETWPWYQKAWFALKRSVILAFIFAPFMCASTLLVLFGKESQNWREIWLQQMLECTQRAGAAFQKFGQWLSMRPDMFPPDVILVLSKLRADAPAHSGMVSRRKLKEHLGKDVEDSCQNSSKQHKIM